MNWKCAPVFLTRHHYLTLMMMFSLNRQKCPTDISQNLVESLPKNMEAVKLALEDQLWNKMLNNHIWIWWSGVHILLAILTNCYLSKTFTNYYIVMPYYIMIFNMVVRSVKHRSALSSFIPNVYFHFYFYLHKIRMKQVTGNTAAVNKGYVCCK